MSHVTPETFTTWQLANMANCASPDRPDCYGFEPDGIAGRIFDPSPGAIFLRRIADAFAEHVEYVGEDFDPDDSDTAGDAADGAVPVYTSNVWATFVDLGAYAEDEIHHYVDNSDDMEKRAQVALYLIGERLFFALADAYRDQLAELEEVGA